MTTEESSYRLPNNTLWEHVAKIAIVEDRPIMLDYWVDSCFALFETDTRV